MAGKFSQVLMEPSSGGVCIVMREKNTAALRESVARTSFLYKGDLNRFRPCSLSLKKEKKKKAVYPGF